MDLHTKCQLQSKIISILNIDNSRNNTFHFIESEIGNHQLLEVISYSVIHNEIFLLNSVESTTIDGCYLQILELLKIKKKEVEYSWTVKWRKNGIDYVSYFRGLNENEVSQKFYHHDSDDKELIEVIKMPIS